MKRDTVGVLAMLLVAYVIAQSIVLFYGQTMRISLIPAQPKRYVRMEKNIPLTHHSLADTIGSVFEMVKLGSFEKYINVDLSKVRNVTRKSKVYSDFRFQLPRFNDNRSRELFLMMKDNLESLVRTPSQLYGELYIVRNGTYDTKLDCGYKSLNTWVNTNRQVISSNWFDVAAPLIVPDGHTFQHFIDGTLPKIIQALPVLQNRKVKIIMKNLRDKIILEMFDRLNISRDQLVFDRKGVLGANYLIYTCITPPVHPDLWQEGRSLLGGKSYLSVPYEQAFVIFITRKGCTNCGRMVLNQEAIIEMLKKRYEENVVKTFVGSLTLAQSVDLFSKARIIMGPHGGGMYNLNFAPSNTTVIEFMPTKSDGEPGAASHQIIWHMAQLQGQDYWRMCIPPTGNNNMTVDMDALSRLLDEVDKHSVV